MKNLYSQYEIHEYLLDFNRVKTRRPYIIKVYSQAEEIINKLRGS